MIRDTVRNFVLIRFLLFEVVGLKGLPNPIEIGQGHKRGTIFKKCLNVEKWPLQTQNRDLINRKRNVGKICGFHQWIAQLKYFFSPINFSIPKQSGNGDKVKKTKFLNFDGKNPRFLFFFMVKMINKIILSQMVGKNSSRGKKLIFQVFSNFLYTRAIKI